MRRGFILPVITQLLICTCYAWIGAHFSSANLSHFTDQKGGAYGHLARAFLKGQVYLDLTPDPLLARVSNPYIPKNRLPGTHILWDYSYYQRAHDIPRFYLYFGPAPALVFYCPILLLTGSMPSSFLVAYLVCSLNLMIFAMLLRLLIHYYFPNTPPVLECLLLFMYGFANFSTTQLAAARVYEIAIASGTTFALAGLLFLFLAFVDSKRLLLWLTLTSLCTGLAFASRVTDIFMCGPLFLGWLYVLKTGRFSLKSALTTGLALFGPIFLCGVALLLYNDVRFENPFEFGTRYLLNNGDCVGRSFFAFSDIPDGLFNYYFISNTYVPFFPYIHPSLEGHLISADSHVYHEPWIFSNTREREDYTGILFSFPICIRALFCFYRLEALNQPNPQLKIWTGLVAAWWLTVTTLLCAFFFLAIRYEMELQMPLLILTTISILAYRAARKALSIREWIINGVLIGYSCWVGMAHGYVDSLIYSSYYYF